MSISTKYSSLLFLLFAIFFAACGSVEPTVPTAQPTQASLLDIQLNQPFTINTAQEARREEAGLTIRLLAVLEDSRCPSRVNCAEAGQARISIQVQQTGQEGVVFELNTNPPLKLDALTYSGYEIRLVALDPYPEEIDQKIALEDYAATFVVSKKT